MQTFVRKHALALGMLILSVVKILMVGNLPLNAMPHAVYDDALMVDTAGSLLSLNWLGPYSEITLVKGPFFPFFLAVSKLFSLPYLLSVTLFYLFACALFVRGIQSVFKNRMYLFILFAVLAWNPISFSVQTFQRIYRFSVMPGLVLMVFGCFFAVYLRREQPLKQQLPWMLTGGLALAALWLTREDGMWVLPFVVVCVAVTAGMLIYRYVKTKQIRYMVNAAASALPIAVFTAVLMVVSLINYSHYGIFATNELSGSNFSKAVKSIYAVKPSEDIPYVSVPRSTLNAIYEVSPTMASFQSKLELGMNDWEGNGRFPGDGEVEDGWFFWCLRGAAAASGYYDDDATAANRLYLDIHNEIEEAFRQNKLERRATMPSALMSPWREGYGRQLWSATLNALTLVAGYGDTGAEFTYFASSYNSTLDLFEFMTRGNILYEGTDVSDTFAPEISGAVGASNAVAGVYQKAGLPLFYGGLAAYLAMSVFMLLRKRSRPKEMFSVWLIATATLLSAVVLCAGVAYTDISAFFAISSSYLAGAYPLVCAYSAIVILYGIQTVVDMVRERSKIRGQHV